jgi:hypothetical protein
MRALTLLQIITLALFASTAFAADYLRKHAETHALLKGYKLEGTYLRSNTPITLSFKMDGTLVNQQGELGRWWVNQQGQYCRVWSTGRLKGHWTCLDLAKEGDGIAIYSNDKKVAEGVLVPEQ